MNKRKKRGSIVFTIVFLLLLFVFLYSGLQILEATIFSKQSVEVTPVASKTITRDGVDYFPKQDINVLMVLGIDKEGPVEDSGSYNNDGEADTVMLLIFDETNETISVLSINRDAMVELPVLGIGGKKVGTMVGQLALAHTYGSGLEDSCENTRETVSNLLYGIRIDHYLAMNIDAIAILNDAVGGVTVNVTDDFSAVDPSITMGEMMLRGEQAITFVRGRKDVADQLNLNRMARQEEYADKFLSTLKAKVAEDSTFVLQAYEEASPYMVTDCSVNVMSSMLERYSDYTLSEMISLEGENVKGEEFMEFYLDEEKMDETVLRLFYAEKK